MVVLLVKLKLENDSNLPCIGAGGGEVGVDLIFQAGLEARFLTLGIVFFP